jgi:hypothetical protein
LTKEQSMDLEFDHGFIPRIGGQNYKAVDRCLGPDSLFDAPLNMPWAIVDAPWAEKNQDFLASLRAQGTQTLLDGAWWRYRYSPNFDVRTMATASWAPQEALSAARPEQLGRAHASTCGPRRSSIPAPISCLGLDPLDIVPAVAQVECLQDFVPPR